MSGIQITVHIDSGTDAPILAQRAADELRDKIENLELTVDGVTSINHHRVTSVKVGKPAAK